MYGESGRHTPASIRRRGLSPRVRGIHQADGGARAGEGSIPACTGNPRRRLRPCRRAEVYPRVYGESSWTGRTRVPRSGLSPRVRGIPRPGADVRLAGGSIPACTGNPDQRVNLDLANAVYPRVYGESGKPRELRQPVRGLSPRVRGIQGGVPAGAVARGSIPACTGNPTADR